MTMQRTEYAAWAGLAGGVSGHPTSDEPVDAAPTRSWEVGWRFALVWVAFGVVVLLLGDVAVRLGPKGSQVAPWWPAAGVSVAALAVLYRRRWWLAAAVLVFSGFGNLWAGRPGMVALGFGLSNAAEALVAAWFLHQRGGWVPRLRSLSDVGRLLTAAVAGALTIGVGAALTVVVATDGAVRDTFVHVIPSHASAVLLLVPLAYVSTSKVRRGPVEVVASWSLVTVSVLVVFGPGQHLPLAFVVMMPLVWSAIRLPIRMVALQLLAVGLLVTCLTAWKAGPFLAAGLGGETVDSIVQCFIVACSTLALSLRAVTYEREAAEDRIRSSSELFRLGFEEALVGMLLLRNSDRGLIVGQANRVAVRKLGVRAGSTVGPELRDDRLRTLVDIVNTLHPGEGWRGEMSLLIHPQPAQRFSVALARLSGAESPELVTCQVVDVTARHHAELELERLARRDHLTGLPNRRSLDQQLSIELAAARAAMSSVAVMFVDLDDFKLINDTSGHESGDRVLVELGERLAKVIRPTDTVARMGGDEFVVLCPGIGTPSAATSMAERVRSAILSPIALPHQHYRVELSIGIALSSPTATASELLIHADLALHASKAAGKHCVTLYTPDLGAHAEARVVLERDLHVAMDRHQFQLHMQPIIDLHTGRILAAEGLIRWRHPARGLLLPSQFLDVVERSGMMPALGAWVLDDACRQAASWIARVGESAPAVHANVSARQLDRPGFAAVVIDTLHRHSLPPDHLVLELTETNLAQVTDALVDELESLVELGVQIAADDYGTGYSPLTRITELPIHMIKIDRQFIDAMTTDERALAIVTSLNDLAGTLHLEVVAEGVETKGHAQLLADIGIDIAQGNLWCAAIAPDDFQNMIVHERQSALTAPGVRLRVPVVHT